MTGLRLPSDPAQREANRQANLRDDAIIAASQPVNASHNAEGENRLQAARIGSAQSPTGEVTLSEQQIKLLGQQVGGKKGF